MEKKINLVVVLGIVVNVAALFLVGIYIYLSFPQPGEFKDKQTVLVPKVYDQDVDTKVSELNKVNDLPINVDPNELGKQNPYNF